MNNVKKGPFCHTEYDLAGNLFGSGAQRIPHDRNQTCEYTQMFLTSITTDDMIVTNT
jgi:hypothetical protein